MTSFAFFIFPLLNKNFPMPWTSERTGCKCEKKTFQTTVYSFIYIRKVPERIKTLLAPSSEYLTVTASFLKQMWYFYIFSDVPAYASRIQHRLLHPLEHHLIEVYTVIHLSSCRGYYIQLAADLTLHIFSFTLAFHGNRHWLMLSLALLLAPFPSLPPPSDSSQEKKRDGRCRIAREYS